MLAGGKGSRTKNIVKNKILMKINNNFLYKKILDKYESDKNYIIINDNKLKKYIKYKNLIFLKIPPTNSMFDTLLKSQNNLINLKNFFLTSCDCLPNFDNIKLIKIITDKNIDVIFFGFNFTNLQKNLFSAHSMLKLSKDKVVDIDVKKKYIQNSLGHAGYFWIRNGNIFNYLNLYKKSNQYKNLKREIIIDDFFKFLINKKLINSSYLIAKNYLHFGSK